MKSILRIQVNRQSREDAVSENALLIDYLRDVLGLTGTKQGCDGGECGACTVLVDGVPRLACSTLAHSVAGRHVETIEGLATQGNLSRLQQAFHEKLGAQCGFCTPGMVMAGIEIVRRHGPEVDAATIAHDLEGNLCRCTGYQNIVAAIGAGAKAMGGANA